jgi:hypothetical protein
MAVPAFGGAMLMNTEQQRILSSKPIGRMRWFASLLSWHGLQLQWLPFSADEMAKWGFPGVVAFYMTPDEKFNLQVNEYPIGQSVTHHATIKARRYGIRDIGWHAFTLFDGDDELRSEAGRLRPWLDRELYKSRHWRRQFKALHPDMWLPSRKKRRGRPARGDG